MLDQHRNNTPIAFYVLFSSNIENNFQCYVHLNKLHLNVISPVFSVIFNPIYALLTDSSLL